MNESPAEAVAKEVREEAGVQARPCKARRRVGPCSAPARNVTALPRMAVVLSVRDHRRCRIDLDQPILSTVGTLVRWTLTYLGRWIGHRIWRSVT